MGHWLGPVGEVIVDVALVGRTGATPVAELAEVVVELGLDGGEEDDEDGVNVVVAVVDGITIVLTCVVVRTEVEDAMVLVRV